MTPVVDSSQFSVQLFQSFNCILTLVALWSNLQNDSRYDLMRYHTMSCSDCVLRMTPVYYHVKLIQLFLCILSSVQFIQSNLSSVSDDI